MIGEFGRPFGIRIDTEKYAFLLRCTPLLGNYNFYCCCYERDVLDRHMERASRGIRFITPFYEEKFRLPDDEQITVRFPDGRTQTHRCRYIDETHFEVDGGREIFHICQYAEKLEAARAVCEPTAKTPKTKEHER